MKKFLKATGSLAFALLSLSTFSSLHAQSPLYDLTLGPVLDTKPDADVSYFGVVDDKVYKIGNENKKPEYQLLGASMEPEIAAPILSEDDQKDGRRHAFTVMLNGEICKFTYTKDKKAVGFRLFGQRVNKKTFLSEGEVKEVAFADIDGEDVLKGLIDPSRFCFRHVVSQDRKTVAILTYETLGREGTGSYAEVRMIDNNFTELWKKKGNTNNVTYGGMTVLGENEVIVFWRSNPPGVITISYQRIGKNGESATLDMELGGKQHIHSMFMLLDKNNQMTFCGFYYEEDETIIKGLYLLKLNSENLETTGKYFAPLDLPSSDMDHAFTHVIDNIKVLDNNDILVLTQQIAMTRTLPQSGTVGSTTIYTYKDITVLRLNSKAEIQWKSVIPMDQLAYDEYAQFAGFTSMVKGDKIFILVNDHPDNVVITKTGKPVEYHTKKDGKLFLLTMDGSGNVTREAFSSKIGEMKLNNSQSMALDDKTLLMYTESGREYQIDKVVFH